MLRLDHPRLLRRCRRRHELFAVSIHDAGSFIGDIPPRRPYGWASEVVDP